MVYGVAAQIGGSKSRIEQITERFRVALDQTLDERTSPKRNQPAPNLDVYKRQNHGVHENSGKGQLIRVILADTQAIFRAGLRKIFALEDDIRVVGQAETLPQTQSAVTLSLIHI